MDTINIFNHGVGCGVLLKSKKTGGQAYENINSNTTVYYYLHDNLYL